MADAVKAIDELLSVRKTAAQEAVYQVLDDGSWTDYSKQQLEVLLESKPSTLFRVAYPSPSLTQPAPVVPETLPCPVHLEPGLKFGKGVRTQCMLGALRCRADYYAELEAMTPEQRAEHDANIAAFKAMLPKPDIEMLSSALRNAPLAPSDSQGKPRAPVVPEEISMSSLLPVMSDRLEAVGYVNGWNACRASMLQGNYRDLSQPVDPQVAEYEEMMNQAGNSPSKYSLRDGIEYIRNSGIPVDVDKIQSERVAGNHTEQHLDMVEHSGDANENVDCRLPFDQWLSQQNEQIDVDCGCVTTEAFYHWLRVAYEAGNSPVTTDGWIPVSERMPEGMKTVITSNGFDIGQGWWDGECWKSFDCHDVVPGKVTHWMQLPNPPKE
ncbi:TPA: DUF551 domain-containing protein [Citrobacter freundii]|uniref:DUF551 domain-containing protein n=1 Tax=Citrobacter TaxID=544 RepID=UPI001F3F383F|nr:MULTISPECIES: DUF551 domain-containing protein [Citrobacter]